ncbi:hypothetical protein JTE90_016574 [Oedothorax gibbosus]|uniref:AP-5 complex subunit mu-1 n=1 Tax=Oedothorax gibbosus TaxID=931172 RepID=A0AAV6UBB6_9ARAC|nr:hypothetical protein JTE90_016574 [Oedothorax gibbosus]
MSLRCACVVSLSKDDFGKILHFRRFPTVEKRCKTTYGEEYGPIPPLPIFINNLLVRLSLSADSKQYVEWRDRSDMNMQLPVVEVPAGKQEIWPVVSIAQNSLLICCLPFVEDMKNVNKENLLNIPSISVGFSVILGMLNFIQSDERNSSLMQLDNYLSLSMPFGTPSDVELSCASYIQKYHTQKFLKKQPAWKPFEYKGKQLIHFKITEFARSAQSDQSGGICHFETFGQVSVKADLEGGLNEVGISVISTDVGHPLMLDSIVIHPCVNIQSGLPNLPSGFPKRLRFSPPLHEFVVFHYCSLQPKAPPIQGVFKMLANNSVELLIQLKLNEKVKNSFDYFEVIVVFFNRGPVKKSEFYSNHGTHKLTEDKYTLKWSLGTKFPKDLEADLSAKLEFHDKPILPNSDPFCVDKNCYAQLNFKQSNSTLSGCNIDAKNVTASEGSKPKVLIERTVQSAEYRIWNSYGDVPFPVNIVNKYNKVFS